MGPPAIVDGLVREIRAEGVFVKNRKMVQIHITVIGDLPVGPIHSLCRKEVPVFKTEVS